MVDGPQNWDDFLDQLQTKADEVCTDIWDKVDWVADKLNSAASGFFATLGHFIPGESDVEKAIHKWNTEIFPAIDKKMSTLQSDIGTAVVDVFGDPPALIGYSKTFIAAKATLYQSNTLSQDITNLGNTWEGPAYKSYSTVATEQNDALLALANNLQAGGQLTRDGADRILQLWLDLLTQFVDFETSALSVIGECADVGKLLGAEISPILDAIALIVQKVADFAILLATFWKNQITQAATGWEILVAGFDGLPNNQWPVITEASSDTMNNPAGWPG